MGDVRLNISPARRHFKQRIGQVNHFLITTLIGLDGVKSKKFTLPEEFSTSWNPRNVERSAERSIRFILDASLSWVVDNLDSYFVEASRKPSIIGSKELNEGYTKADRSVNKRFGLFYHEARRTTNIDKYAALVALAIQWRNNTVHYGANNELDDEYRSLLVQHKDYYMGEFRHLDVEEMLKSFDSKDGHPTFKEVTSMINAIHKYVECVDEHLLKSLDLEQFKKDLLDKHCSMSKQTKRKINNLTKERKEVYLKTLYRQYGLEVEDAVEEKD
ncbi:MAG: hypothetical protein IJ190_05920 [Prevotella sp.]|nr:hypothetical protein [Prevotella sp.]